MALYPCINNDDFEKLLVGSITKINSFVDRLRGSAFANCVDLTDVNLPNVTEMGSTIFGYCTSLEKVYLPNVTLTGSNLFINCTSLKEVIFNNINVIPTGSFLGCTSFDTLVLRNNTMVTSVGTQPFTNTQFWSTGNGGKLYVPQALISTYQNNTTWSNVLALNANNQILAIEGSPYEN